MKNNHSEPSCVLRRNRSRLLTIGQTNRWRRDIHIYVKVEDNEHLDSSEFDEVVSLDSGFFDYFFCCVVNSQRSSVSSYSIDVVCTHCLVSMTPLTVVELMHIYNPWTLLSSYRGVVFWYLDRFFFRHVDAPGPRPTPTAPTKYYDPRDPTPLPSPTTLMGAFLRRLPYPKTEIEETLLFRWELFRVFYIVETSLPGINLGRRRPST